MPTVLFHIFNTNLSLFYFSSILLYSPSFPSFLPQFIFYHLLPLILSHPLDALCLLIPRKLSCDSSSLFYSFASPDSSSFSSSPRHPVGRGTIYVGNQTAAENLTFLKCVKLSLISVHTFSFHFSPTFIYLSIYPLFLHLSFN